MKRRFICSVISGMLLFISCDKEVARDNYRTPVGISHSQADTLKGREFEFSNLVWEDTEFGNGFILIKDRQDLFFNPDRELEVSIKLDTSSLWLGVVPIRSNPGTFFQTYIYALNSGSIAIWPYPSRPALIGTSASLKIKFL